ncbi:MAG: TIR domain-containing protein [Candidatus Zixiibacteriota bacterium]
MKIFISWSGARSKAVAEELRDWLEMVIQATEPFLSSRDIERGALWFPAITGELKESSIGIVCLTHENKEEPWILFEAGALAKGLTTTKVCTLLIDMEKSDVSGPLAQFQHTLPTKEEMRELIRTINNHLVEKKLKDQRLSEIFDTNWPGFEAKFKNALEKNPAGAKPVRRDQHEILVEILETTRAISHKVLREAGRSQIFLSGDKRPIGSVMAEDKGDLAWHPWKGTAKEMTEKAVCAGLPQRLIIPRLMLEYGLNEDQALKLYNICLSDSMDTGQTQGSGLDDI